MNDVLNVVIIVNNVI